MFIQTEETPNPATLKFLPGQDVLSSGVADFTDAKTAAASPLAESLFTIDGVAGVFLGKDFITVTKGADKSWPLLKPAILSIIMDHFTHNRPMMKADAPVAATPAAAEGENSAVIQQIRDLLDAKIRPAVAQDGGDITFERFEDGVVYLHLKGACAGCPSSTMTLKAGVENMLKHYIPDVKEVRQSR